MKSTYSTLSHFILRKPSNEHVPSIKKFEQKLFEHHSPPEFNSQSNYSASVTLPMNDDKLMKYANDFEALIKISNDLIRDHAERKIDLFFYTLVAYYHTKYYADLGLPKIHYGRERNFLKNSPNSITPALLDTTIYHKNELYINNYNNLLYHTSILCGTHFMHNLNSTTELPYLVNEMHHLLESYYAKFALQILNDVSYGSLDPINGLTKFFGIIECIFNDIHKDNYFHESIDQLSREKSQQLKIALLELIKKSMFKNKWDTQAKILKEDYVHMLLRLKPGENIKDKYKAIQQEIKETPGDDMISFRDI